MMLQELMFFQLNLILEVDTAAVQEAYSNWTVKNQASIYAFSMAQQNAQSVLSLLR